MKEELLNKIRITKSLHDKALADFISTNTRKDRDRFLRFRYKLETYNEIMEML